MTIKTKLSKLRHEGHITDVEYAIIINMLNKFATQSPKTQPCEDAISRQAAINAIKTIHPVDTEYDCTLYDKLDVMYVLNDLPPVTPKAEPFEDCISREATVKTLYKFGHSMNEKEIGLGSPYMKAARFIQDDKDKFPSVIPKQKVRERMMNCDDCVYSDIADWDKIEDTGKVKPVLWCEKYRHLCSDITGCEYYMEDYE